MKTATDTQILGAVLDYVQRGWPVFPVYPPSTVNRCHCPKRMKCSSPGKHPLAAAVPQGLKNATTDEKQAREWWREWPNANVAIVCGAESGIAVVDIDPDHDGHLTLRTLEKTHGKLPSTPMVRTGSLGRHYYFKHPGGKVTSRKGFVQGIDSQADGAYVVAPPSLHRGGRLYEWRTPLSTPLAPYPEWLLAMIPRTRKASARATKARRAQGDGAGMEEIEDGQRNHTLARIAGVLRHWGAGEIMIHAALSGINEECCDEPLPDTEVEAIARSVSRYDS